jgi:hypothetical protein
MMITLAKPSTAESRPNPTSAIEPATTPALIATTPSTVIAASDSHDRRFTRRARRAYRSADRVATGAAGAAEIGSSTDVLTALRLSQCHACSGSAVVGPRRNPPDSPGRSSPEGRDELARDDAGLVAELIDDRERAADALGRVDDHGEQGTCRRSDQKRVAVGLVVAVGSPRCPAAPWRR